MVRITDHKSIHKIALQVKIMYSLSHDSFYADAPIINLQDVFSASFLLYVSSLILLS